MHTLLDILDMNEEIVASVPVEVPVFESSRSFRILLESGRYY